MLTKTLLVSALAFSSTISALDSNPPNYLPELRELPPGARRLDTRSGTMFGMSCTAGEYLFWDIFCVTCPAGYACDGTSMTQCSAGTYAASGSSSCTQCPAGYYCPSAGLSSATACPAGTYSSTVGASSSSTCKTCPHNSYALTAGSTSCVSLSSLHLGRRGERKLECPEGQKSCPVPGWRGQSSGGGKQAYECVDVENDLESCGGCMAAAGLVGEEEQGTDCTTLRGVDSVSCRRGRCVVESCRQGYVVAKDRAGCEPSLKSVRRHTGSSRAHRHVF